LWPASPASTISVHVLSRRVVRLRWPIKAQPGDRIEFRMNKQPIAEAVISRIEKPGESECATTGRFANLLKVFWMRDSFKKLEAKR
jgi:hypothetical protein